MQLGHHDCCRVASPRDLSSFDHALSLSSSVWYCVPFSQVRSSHSEKEFLRVNGNLHVQAYLIVDKNALIDFEELIELFVTKAPTP